MQSSGFHCIVLLSWECIEQERSLKAVFKVDSSNCDFFLVKVTLCLSGAAQRRPAGSD